jgi:transposase
MKKYKISLTAEERHQLEKITSSGRGPARTYTRAHILLKADQSDEGPAWSDEKISEAFDVTVLTVQRVRQQLVEEGFEAVLSRHAYHTKVSRRKMDGDLEAHLVTLVCSDAPEGRSRWTLRLLADTLVELGFIDSISHETVSRTLKKTKLSLG